MEFSGKNLLVCCSLLLILSGCSSNDSSAGRPNSSPSPQTKATDEGPRTTNADQPPEQENGIEFAKVGVIREFGGTDNAALFGLLPKHGNLQIDKVVGPGFIKSYLVGELNQVSIEKVFAKTSRPLSASEKQKLLAEFNGATVIYAEGYAGHLCNTDEITYRIEAAGKIDETSINIAFQFEALPNSSGNCSFHSFGVETRYSK